MVPPLLELYVLWHPADRVGEEVATALLDHFHGPAYAGLAGGAVEVYVRSQAWRTGEGPPRPLALHTPLPHELPAAQFTVVLPVLGVSLARAVEKSLEWRQYLADIVSARQRGESLVVPLRVPGVNLTRSLLADLFEGILGVAVASRTETLCRDVAQAMAQRLADAARTPLTVFVSHTKHASLLEKEDEGPGLYERVRRVISDTRLHEFFDARDLQPGGNWERAIEEAAGRCALLMVRTDHYARRDWTQAEVLFGKRHEVPVVALHALRAGEDRGSFLMDHVPVVPCDPAEPDAAILRSLNRLVDEALKRVLWARQRVYLQEHAFDWFPPHAPEPVTPASFLQSREVSMSTREGDDGGRRRLWVIHPDPPLGLREREVLVDLCALAGYCRDDVEVLTPRTFAARGGRVA